MEGLSSAVMESEWVDASPLEAKLDASDCLIVFDFDCTLAALHMYFALRSPEGQMALSKNADAFFTDVFGGEERRARLALHLRRLTSAGATLAVLSNGVEAEINQALTSAGLAGFFSAVMGAESQNAAGTANKPAFLSRLVIYRGTSAPLYLVFLDDDLSNYPGQGIFDPKSHPPVEGSCWRLDIDAASMPAPSESSAPKSDDSAPAVPRTCLVAWPIIPADGISEAAMDRLEALLGADGPELPPGL